MNKNQFFYEESSAKQEEGQVAVPAVNGSINLDKVIRTVEYEPGKLAVILDDFHEETMQIPIANPKGKNNGAFKSQSMLVYSKVYLNESDSVRFKEVTEFP